VNCFAAVERCESRSSSLGDTAFYSFGPGLRVSKLISEGSSYSLSRTRHSEPMSLAVAETVKRYAGVFSLLKMPLLHGRLFDESDNR